MNLGAYLKKLRENAEFSQDFVSQKISVSRPTYVLIEKGERELTVSEAQRLSGLFAISLEDLLNKRTPKEIDIKPKKTIKVKEKIEERISVPQEKVDKFKEVLLYILREVGAKPNIGEALLCKLLYFIDFDYYEKFEEQLIGAKYIKNHYGPTPIEFTKIVRSMELNKDLVKITNKYFGYDQKKYLPIREPDISILKSEEIEVIDSVLARLSDKSASEMKYFSHGDVPWLTAEDGKVIDYESVFYRTPAYSVRNYTDEIQEYSSV